MNIHIFGKEIIDEKTIKQFEDCMLEDTIGVLTADAHYGYGVPVGGCIAYKDKISPTGVGYDIGCGNYAVRTNIPASRIKVANVMDEIVKRISFGIGTTSRSIRSCSLAADTVIEAIREAPFEPQRELLKLAEEQLGSVGGGNHFVDLFEDEEGMLWIGVHFGSRGFGHKTATGFFALAQGLKWGDKAGQGRMDEKPIVFDTNTTLGQDYIQAMLLAGAYAFAGRDVVVKKVLDILDNPDTTYEVHNHHNFAWKETHFGEDWWVVRKGCTPARPGQTGFIGANMADHSVIIEGVDSLESQRGLYSTIHGAGRVMSRTQAAGKQKWIRGHDGVKRPKRITEGLIDFDKVKESMKYKKIELRGGGADEAPLVYKKLPEVLQYHDKTIKILFTLKPIGVAMAGEGDYDPYKD